MIHSWAVQFYENTLGLLNDARQCRSQLSRRAFRISCCSLFLLAQHAWSAGGGQSASGQSEVSASAPQAVGSGSAVELPSERSLFHVFLLMGQSNMAGYGCVAVGDACPPDWNAIVKRVLVLDGQGLIDSAVPMQPIRWRAGSQPLHLNQPPTARYGLGMDFAKAYMAAHPGVTVGLVPCAWGGAPIDRLNEGTADYDNCIARARYAANTGMIMGVLVAPGRERHSHAGTCRQLHLLTSWICW